MNIPRYLINFDSAKLPSIFTDILVVGGGIAGLRAAIEAGKYGKVLLIAKDSFSECNTAYAQGGIAAHIDDKNLVSTHIKDTEENGQGLNNPHLVQLIIKKGVENIKELIKWGVTFDKHGDKYDLAREGGHKLSRILHAGGDKTGKELLRVLLDKAGQISNIEFKDNIFSVDLLTDEKNSCRGVIAFQKQTKSLIIIQAKKIILATGGAGQIYRETTNPEIATGDGVSMAYRAGGQVQDMEFMQFHPTALYVAGAVRALISEAVRGAGGLLLNKNRKYFMKDYHPMAELAPRDIVSRSIIDQMRKTNDTSVYLDVSHLGEKKVKARFPGLYQLCQNFGINITKDLIPVRPSAHYMIGGIKIKTNGATNLANLFAAGECASSGFHGANRLGSNSLLESLVIGAICGKTAGEEMGNPPGRAIRTGKNFEPLNIDYRKNPLPIDSINLADAKNSLQSLMWRLVGIERDKLSLTEALRKIDFWDSYILPKTFNLPEGWELQNMLIFSRLTAQSALMRTESRGVHYRTDYPKTDDKKWKTHIILDIKD
jgi:L-aspartate oxidase